MERVVVEKKKKSDLWATGGEARFRCVTSVNFVSSSAPSLVRNRDEFPVF